MATLPGAATGAVDGPKHTIETVVAWASVAYAAGFVTVMAHTSRLGLPVIELIKPIYVWIGVPFAVVFFFTRHLRRLIRERIDLFQAEAGEIKGVLTEAGPRVVPTPDKVVASLLEIASTSVVGLILRPTDMIRAVADLLAWAAHKVDDSNTIRQARLAMKALLAGTLILRFVNRIVTFVVLVAMIPFALWAYAWLVYPRIPQSWGGGRPTPVVLLIDKEKVPYGAGTGLFAQAPVKEDSSKTVATATVNLLYATKDEVFVQRPGGAIISIARPAIHATHWITSH